MNHFDLARSLVERCHGEAATKDFAGAFEHALATLGFQHFACCSHVDPLHPPRGAVLLHNYPREWVRCFSELDFYDIDPVFQYVNRTLLPFENAKRRLGVATWVQAIVHALCSRQISFGDVIKAESSERIWEDRARARIAIDDGGEHPHRTDDLIGPFTR